MKPLLFLLLILSIFGRDAVAEPLNVMSWNIRYDNPGDGANAWPKRKDWVAEIILRNNIDIAGFQEVLAGQFEDLKARLPEMEAYGVGRNDGKKAGEFTPIFYRKDRFKAIASSTFWLSPTPDEPASKGWDAALPRIASWIKFQDRKTAQQFYVINTHFDHRGAQARTESATLLVKSLQEKFSDLPVILTGDFNTTPQTAPHNMLVGAGNADQSAFFDAYDHSAQKPEGPNSTWNGFQAVAPDQRIDFVFVTKSVSVRRFQILDDQRDGRFPSDHLPIVTRLELPAK